MKKDEGNVSQAEGESCSSPNSDAVNIEGRSPYAMDEDRCRVLHSDIAVTTANGTHEESSPFGNPRMIESEAKISHPKADNHKVHSVLPSNSVSEILGESTMCFRVQIP